MRAIFSHIIRDSIESASVHFCVIIEPLCYYALRIMHFYTFNATLHLLYVPSIFFD